MKLMVGEIPGHSPGGHPTKCLICLVMVEWLFLAVTWGCLRFVIVVFPDHTHLLFLVLLNTSS